MITVQTIIVNIQRVIMSVKERLARAKVLIIGMFDPSWDWKLGLSINQRLIRLEEWTHPPVAPGGATELDDKIRKLEKRIAKLEKK
tara:strand:+ start:96 stop:353 length:258 start_codon:yes stop_codon:yes gene_type:complete